MSSFHVTCTTCQSRLKVRSEAAIGQIVACPKCASMVLIQSPERPAAADAASASPAATASRSNVASEAARGVTTPPAPSPLQDTAPADVPIESLAAGGAEFSAEEQGLADLGDAEKDFRAGPPAHASPGPVPGPVNPIAAENPPPPEANDDRGPLVPDERWTSPVVQQVRQYLLIGAAAMAGVVLAIALFVFAVVHFSSPRSAANAADGDEENDTAALARADDGAAEPTDDDSEIEAHDDESAPPSADGDASLPADDSTVDVPAGPADDGALFPPLPPAVGEDGDTESEPGDGGDAPPGLVAVEADAPPAGGDADDFPDELKPFAPFLSDEPIDVGDPLGPVAGPGGAAAPPGDPPLPRPEPLRINVAARLADPIAAMEFASIPLVEFVRLLSQMSTLPMTLDPEGLLAAGVSPESAVSLSVRDATVADVLSSALSPLGLAFSSGDGHVFITKAPAAGELREARYDIADLAGDGEQIAGLKGVIVRLVDPQSWNSAGGAGSLSSDENALVVKNTEPVHFQLRVLLGKLRLAHGLPGGTELPPSLAKLSTRRESAGAKLEHVLTLNYSQRTPLVEVLARIEQETGTRLLIDWRAAAEAGWNPRAVVTFVADKETLAESLTALLRPMDLTYRVVDAATLQVTTPEQLMLRQEIEIFPVEDLLAKETLERIAARLIEELASGGAVRGAVFYDETSHSVVTSLSQPDQQFVSHILGEWRTSAGE